MRTLMAVLAVLMVGACGGSEDPGSAGTAKSVVAPGLLSQGSRLKARVTRSPDGLAVVRSLEELLDTQEHVICQLRATGEAGHSRCIPTKTEDGQALPTFCDICGQQFYADSTCSQPAIQAPDSADLLIMQGRVFSRGAVQAQPFTRAAPGADCTACTSDTCVMSAGNAYALGDDVTSRFVELVDGWE